MAALRRYCPGAGLDVRGYAEARHEPAGYGRVEQFVNRRGGAWLERGLHRWHFGGCGDDARGETPNAQPLQVRSSSTTMPSDEPSANAQYTVAPSRDTPASWSPWCAARESMRLTCTSAPESLV